MAEQNEAEKAVELFHSYHVYVFLQSVSQAATRLNQALEQIKAAGLPIPPAPTTVPSFPQDATGAPPTTPGGSGLQILAAAANPAAPPSHVNNPSTWVTASPGGGSSAAAAALQALLASPVSRGPSLPSLTTEGLFASQGTPGPTPAKLPPPAKPSAASLAQSLANATSNPVVPLTPTANKKSDRRKRSAGEAALDGVDGQETQASPGKRGTKRKVQVVSTASWPKPGDKAPDWSKRAAALAMVAAAAERQEQHGDTDSATTASNEHAMGDPEFEHSSKYDARLGMWSESEKRDLVNAVRELNPCGAGEWEAVAERLGRGPRGGASAERMYRTLTDPAYHKSSNPHGRRINPRKGSTPMHVMAAYALQRLPDNEGNLSQIGDLIKNNPHFSKELDWSPRPGTKTYPRWKDALVGCFKPGRYPHLIKTERKTDGLTVYKLDQSKVRTQFEENK